MSASKSIDAAGSQKGSWLWLPFGVVALNKFVTSFLHIGVAFEVDERVVAVRFVHVDEV